MIQRFSVWQLEGFPALEKLIFLSVYLFLFSGLGPWLFCYD